MAMKIFTLLLLCYSIGQRNCEKGQKMIVAATEGNTVSIYCPYETEQEVIVKGLCKESCFTSQDHMIRTGDLHVTSGRFSLDDDRLARRFSVTITNVTVRDSGIYHCKVEVSLALQYYQEVELHISAAEKLVTYPDIIGIPLLTLEDENASGFDYDYSGSDRDDGSATYDATSITSLPPAMTDRDDGSATYDATSITSLPPAMTEGRHTRLIILVTYTMVLLVAGLVSACIIWRAGKQDHMDHTI